MSATEIINELPKLTETERRAVHEKLLELSAARETVGFSKASDKITSLPDFAARRKAIFPKPIPAAQSQLLDKLIAGE